MGFYECSKLTSINIPNSVTSIGDAAFGRLPAAISIQSLPISLLNGGESEWNRIGFPKATLESYILNHKNEEDIRPLATALDIKRKGSYDEVKTVENGGNKFFRVKKDGHYGLVNDIGHEIVPTEMEALESAGTGYLRYKLNGFWGLMDYAGKIIIDTDRGYTSIGDFVTFTKRFPYTMTGFKGECDINGRQISKIKVETPPQQQVVVTQEQTPQKQEEKKVEEIIIKHDPVPMQVWKQCTICYGSGKCQVCGGTGIFTSWSGRSICEYGCGGSGRCSFCAGQGGHYEVEYK